MSQSNDSGLNLDHLEARIEKLRAALQRVSETRFGWDGDCGVVSVADDALSEDDAALANQPAPTVPDLETAFDALESYGENGDYVLASDVYDAFVKGSHQPAQEQAEPFSPTDQQYADWCDRHDLPPHQSRDAFDDAASLYLATQQEPVAAPQQCAAPGQEVARYQWLKSRFTGYDFYWGGDPMAEMDEDKGKCVIVFECGQDFRAGRDFEQGIDAAIQRAAQLDGGQEAKD